MRLTDRELNRATLARQSLLSREPLDVGAAVHRFGALQAQEPASPFLALLARVDGLSADDVISALRRHDIVKATLHRSTLHIVSREVYQSSISALLQVTRTRWMQEQRGLPVNRSLATLTDESLAFASVPRTNVELRDHAGTLDEPIAADELWRRIRRFGPFVHVPTDDPWGYGRRPVQIDASAWFEAPEADEDASLEAVVRAHLRGFGPSRLADVSQWSGLAVGRLRVGLERIEGLERHQDELGRELFDLPGGAIPDGDVAAAPRLLPMWDETLLAYRDRSRVLPEAYRKRVIVRAGDVLPTFTIDGAVAGLWWAEAEPDAGTTVVLEPFEPIPGDAAQRLHDEATRVARFVAPREPGVYTRYRHTRRRD